MVIHRKDAKGEAGSSRMFSEHSRRRTGATGFVAPWAATKQTLCALCAFAVRDSILGILWQALFQGSLSGEIGQAYRHAPRAPAAGFGLEHAGAGSAAGLALAVFIEIPGGEIVPVASDDLGAAVVAIGRIARFVVHVAGIGIAHAEAGDSTYCH